MVKRRFLVSLMFPKQGGFGFASIYHERYTDTLPTPMDIVVIRGDVAKHLGISATVLTVMNMSEVSSEGESVV